MNSAKNIYRISTITLLILCLLSIAVPAAATDTAAPPSNTGYGMYITCYYSGADEDDTLDLAAAQENVFLLTSKTSGQYVVAKYQEQTNTHQVTEYTTSSDKATQFRCGTDPDFPHELRIHGLKEDTYLLRHTQTQSGYLIFDDIEICLSSAGVIVNGSAMDSYTDPDTGETIVPLEIEIAKDFPLPATCYWCRLRLSVEDGSYLISRLITFGLLMLLTAVILHIVRSCAPARLAAIGALLLQLFLIILSILVTVGCIPLGPVSCAIEFIAFFLHVVFCGVACFLFR